MKSYKEQLPEGYIELENKHLNCGVHTFLALCRLCGNAIDWAPDHQENCPLYLPKSYFKGVIA